LKYNGHIPRIEKTVKYALPMTRLTRTSPAFLLILIFGMQSLSAFDGSIPASQAAWQHWQFHSEHGGSLHDDHVHDTTLAGDKADHERFENLLHVDMTHAGIIGLVFASPVTDGVKVPSRPILQIPPSHSAPHLGVDTPPPIA